MIPIKGRLDISLVEELRTRLLELLESPEPCLDLSELSSCDTAGLQLLLSAHRSAAAAGKTLRFAHPPSCLTALAAQLGLAAQFQEVPH